MKIYTTFNHMQEEPDITVLKYAFPNPDAEPVETDKLFLHEVQYKIFGAIILFSFLKSLL